MNYESATFGSWATASGGDDGGAWRKALEEKTAVLRQRWQSPKPKGAMDTAVDIYTYPMGNFHDRPPGEVQDPRQREAIGYLINLGWELEYLTVEGLDDAFMPVVRGRLSRDGGTFLYHIGCLCGVELLLYDDLRGRYDALIAEHGELSRCLLRPQGPALPAKQRLALDAHRHEVHCGAVLIGLFLRETPLCTHYRIAAAFANLAEYGLPGIPVRSENKDWLEIVLPVFSRCEHWNYGQHWYSETEQWDAFQNLETLLLERFPDSIRIACKRFQIGHRTWALEYHLPFLTLRRDVLREVVPLLAQYLGQKGA